jgi:flagellar protein FliS
MSAEAARQRYLADRVTTATPAQRVVMLYDRLAVDIERGAAAQEAGDLVAASGPLLHAQQIVTELLASLDTTTWSGAEDLAALYRYLLLELIHVRGEADPARARASLTIVLDLGSAWRTAADELASGYMGGSADGPDGVPLAAAAWVG